MPGALLALVLLLAGGPPGATAAAAAGPLPPAGPSAEADVPAPARPPARVVSMNLCTDLMAMLVAAPGQLVSVSHVAHDPVASPLAEMAAAYPANRAQAEEIALLAPDLVLAGEYDNPATLAMLERLGLGVARFPLEASIADVRANLRRIGGLLGAPSRSAALIAAMDAALGTPPGPDTPRPRAVLHYANAYTSGAGTLADDVLAAAGLRNVAAELGLAGMARLPLETLILAAPDLIITGEDYPGPALAQEILRHPAARALDGTARVTVPDNLWTCGTPLIAEAVARLRAQADALRLRAQADALRLRAQADALRLRAEADELRRRPPAGTP